MYPVDSISTFCKTGPSQLKESFISELGQHAFKKPFFTKSKKVFTDISSLLHKLLMVSLPIQGPPCPISPGGGP